MKPEPILPAQSQTAHTRLQAPWLLPARIFWLVATAIAIGLFIAGLPARSTEIDNLYRGSIQALLLQNQKGEVVLSPVTGSAALRAGAVEGDILLAVNNEQVTTPQQAYSLLAGAIGTQVTLSVRTGDFPARQVTVTRSSELGEILLRFGLSSGFAVFFVLASEILFTLLCLGMAFLIFWRRSDDWMALLASLILTMILVGLSLPVISFTRSPAIFRNPPLLDVWYALAFGLLLIFFYLFPGGQFIPRVTIILTGLLVLWTALELIDQSWYPWYMPRTVYALVVAVWLISGVLALVYRYFYLSDSAQRQQIRWIIWGATVSAVGLFLQIIPLDFNLMGPTRVLYDFVLYPLGQLFKLLLPVAIGAAIIRYRLWNIELIINRALVYGTLTLLTMGVYLVTVAVLGLLVNGLTTPAASFLATGLVAILFEPLRRRIQGGINRLMYGKRDDPYQVLSSLTRRLEQILAPGAVLPALVETVAQALKLPYVSVQLKKGEVLETAAEYGKPVPDPLRLALVYQNEAIGELLLGRRAAGEEFSPQDHKLLADIARVAGTAAYNVLLTGELQRSRARVVTAREEERRRLRRDLHDGLGPILASQGLKLAAVSHLVDQDPAEAHRLLDNVILQNENTVGDVRRLVTGLRPPALDELGLANAIREQILQPKGGSPSPETLQVQVEVEPENLPPLPAAVEVNAYRITLEALTNVIRHAGARTCRVQIALNGNEAQPALVLQVSDDGRGIPPNYLAGVGLASMRERAEEIGGKLTVQAAPLGGTQVTAWLPLAGGGLM